MSYKQTLITFNNKKYNQNCSSKANKTQLNNKKYKSNNYFNNNINNKVKIKIQK